VQRPPGIAALPGSRKVRVSYEGSPHVGTAAPWSNDRRAPRLASRALLGQSDLRCFSRRETEVAGHPDQGLPDHCLDLLGTEAERRGYPDR
jgi:hypothetical protein